MKILDKYILKKYFTSFLFTLIILIPIAVAIDVSEKVGSFLKADNLALSSIIKDYYGSFIVNYGNTFMPLALFISVIMFTSKLSGNTEIIAIHSSGISFKRFLRPYIIGATVIAFISLYANHFIVPKTNGIHENFKEEYLRSNHKKKTKKSVGDVNLQLSDNDYIFIGKYNFRSNTGYHFSYEHFEGNQLKYKIIGQNLKWIEKDSIFKISNFKKRHIKEKHDIISSGVNFDTVFSFQPKDLLYVDYLARAMTSVKLYEHIRISEERGVKNLNNYKVELYRRTSLPISSFILTLIAVTMASKKRRGGIGVNLASGLGLMFLYVFFMKVSEVLGATADASPLFMVWMPNMIFGALAFYLYLKAKK